MSLLTVAWLPGEQEFPGGEIQELYNRGYLFRQALVCGGYITMFFEKKG